MLLVAGMVDLVEDDHGPGGEATEHGKARGDLLIGRDDAVHIGGQAGGGGGPVGVQMQSESGGGLGPLELEVGGGGDDDESSTGASPEFAQRRGQGKRGLSRSGGGDGKKIWTGFSGGGEAVECGFLPGPESYYPRHQDCGTKTVSR